MSSRNPQPVADPAEGDIAPAPGGLGEMAVAARSAIFNAITHDDLAEIARAQVKKAKGGDTAAAKFLFEFLAGPRVVVIAGNPATPASAGPVVRLPAAGSEKPLAVDAGLEERLKGHPLWKPAPFPRHDPRYGKLVKARQAAGIPLEHPDDPAPDLS